MKLNNDELTKVKCLTNDYVERIINDFALNKDDGFCLKAWIVTTVECSLFNSLHFEENAPIDEITKLIGFCCAQYLDSNQPTALVFLKMLFICDKFNMDGLLTYVGIEGDTAYSNQIKLALSHLKEFSESFKNMSTSFKNSLEVIRGMSNEG